MTTEPLRSVEIERKYDVDGSTSLPDWSSVPGVLRVSDGESRALDARYFDTEDAALSQVGIAVRRRTGGHDEGWHIKGPREGDSRIELQWPLGEGDEVPAEVRAALVRWTSDRLHPLARIENARTAYLLQSEDGVLAEFVDDRVRTTDLRGGKVREWREWELELGPAAPSEAAAQEAFFAAAEWSIRATGARDSASDSKLARALGF